MFHRTKHVRPYNWLPDFGEPGSGWEDGPVINQEFLAACPLTPRTPRSGVAMMSMVVLAPEPLLNDLHVKQPRNPQRKPETQRNRAFRLINER